jgi:GntR family histidine utilization transcriptional repressor
VARPVSQAAVLEIHDIRTEVQALGLPYRYQLVSKRSRRPTAADRRHFAAGGRLLALTCLHFAGGRPFCLEERLISLESVPEAARESFAEIAPGPWLISRVPWSAAEHTIRAVAADTATARALGIAEGSACLVVERRTWSAEQPVTFVRLFYAGDSHALVARFTPS